MSEPRVPSGKLGGSVRETNIALMGFRATLASVLERRFNLIAGVVLAILLAFAWHDRFVQDDAFIAFRYAENWAHGRGLVFNPGEAVEGYTCFLYVILIGLGLKAGVEPVACSYAIGLVACAGTLLATQRLAAGLSGNRSVGLLAMLLLGLNRSFSHYATGGLETQLQTFLVTAALLVGVREIGALTPSPRGLAAFSALTAMALLTRLDSAALLALMALSLLVVSWRGNPVARSLRLAALVAPVGLAMGIWIAWKLAFYGNALPNTFYAKIPGHSLRSLGHGAWYIFSFLDEYWLAIPLVLALFAVRDLRGSWAPRILLGSLALWCGYVIAVGGDFMEFRFMIPALPILFWILAAFAEWLEQKANLGVALVLLILFGNVARAAHEYRNAHWDGVETIQSLASHTEVSGDDWIGIGEDLGKYFAHDPSVSISVTAAGAVPYYSGLTTVDMLGLNDPWIARHGELVKGDRPGHQRIASFELLKKRGVNLVIGHPTAESLADGDTFVMPQDRLEYLGLGSYAPTAAQQLLADVRAIEIPISTRQGQARALYALYVTPSARVDDVIRAHGWRVLAIKLQSSE